VFTAKIGIETISKIRKLGRGNCLFTGDVRIGSDTAPTSALDIEGTIKIKEQAAADADVAAYGQLWVKTATPCELWYTDDAGTDTRIV